MLEWVQRLVEADSVEGGVIPEDLVVGELVEIGRLVIGSFVELGAIVESAVAEGDIVDRTCYIRRSC